MLLPSLRPWFRWEKKPMAHRTSRLVLERLEVRTAPAVFVVNSLDDTVEAVRDGSGLDEAGNISLRSAIMAVNDLGGEHTIQLPAGTYQLTRAPDASDGDASGNLNVGNGLTQIDLTIEGEGRDATRIDAAWIDQALNVGFFTAVTLRGLAVENGAGTFGGGVANAGWVTLADVALRGNWASHGAGLFSTGTAVLSNVLVEGNFGVQGGGIHNGGDMTIDTTTVAANYAGQGGGIFNARNLTLSQSTVSDNWTQDVTGWGGGIFNQADMALTNVTVAQNGAAFGGGIYSVGFGNAVLMNCTIAANVATGHSASAGGGIFVGNGTPAVWLKNTIVAQNWSDRAPDVSGTIVSLGTNLIGDGTGGDGFAETDFVGTSESPFDPLLGPLQDNGGPTKTMALLAGSIAINAGDAEWAPTVDQRGFARDRSIDIGAFEFLEE